MPFLHSTRLFTLHWNYPHLCIVHLPSGVVLLLDSSLLLTTAPGQISLLLKLLRRLKKLMGKEARVMAYAQQEHLQAAAERFPASGASTAEQYLQVLNTNASGMVSLLKRSLISCKLEPQGTHMLRTAVKVSRAWKIGAMLCDYSRELAACTLQVWTPCSAQSVVRPCAVAMRDSSRFPLHFCHARYLIQSQRIC